MLNLPSLRVGKDDITLIAEAQIEKSCKDHKIPTKEFSSDFLENITKYDWPGNVRELINAIETSITTAQ